MADSNLDMTATSPEEPTSDPPAKKRRRNTARACDHCKSKKIKCNGVQPCSRCETHNMSCTYDTPYSRGLAPPVVPTAPRYRLESSGAVLQPPEHSPHTPNGIVTSRTEPAVQAEGSRDETPEYGSEGVEGTLGQSSNIAFSHAARLELSSRPPTPPMSSTGPAVLSPSVSGAIPAAYQPGNKLHAELQSLSRRQAQKRTSRSQWYLSEPQFPDLDIARYSLPSTERGLELCSWYFENGTPTYRFLHRPSVERLVKGLCQTGEWLGGTNTSKGPEKLTRIEECLVLMVWAVGCQYPMSRTGKPFDSREMSWLRQKGMEYYQVCQLLMEKEKSLVDRLPVLQVRILMCLYLLTMSRLKAAWDLFAVVKNMASNLDLNKTDKIVPGKTTTPRSHHDGCSTNVAPILIQTELRKRAFWTIYTLDIYLSAVLGRNFTFDDKDIKTDHPTLDDEFMGPNEQGISINDPAFSRPGTAEDVPSLLWASTAHAKLARIVSRTLRSLYLDSSSEYRFDTMDGLVAEVYAWERELPDFLRIRTSGSLLPIYARQSSVIRLAQQHALIMIYRPSLPLSGIAIGRDPERLDAGLMPTLRLYQDRCLDAAFVICDIISPLFRKRDINSQFWWSAYINFCAATVMLVYLVHNPTVSSERKQQIWDGVDCCCGILKAVSSENRLSRRYVAALEDLSKRVKKRLASFTDEGRRESGIATSPHVPSHITKTSEFNDAGIAGFSVPQLQGASPATYVDDFNLLSPDVGSTSFTLDLNQPWDNFLTGASDDTSFFDLDSLISGGKFWNAG